MNIGLAQGANQGAAHKNPRPGGASPGRGYAKAKFPASGNHKGDKSPHEMHNIGNLIQKILAPAISNKGRHPGKPEKVTELLHDIHPHMSV
ncbi:MAG: hypothetical protein KUA37_07830 [Desulfomicrobium sp.]|nr:hypothetical protein [Pseudomonadota bacterium]MBV1711900.1 hypothetical protein [Desulfomicrobium sp.]MBU4571077.1 hypothetical protein [Pseudomonadota bacterium]MBU4593706.1 hypothetical protein [Pseudomonadota bacterium]MBV1719038.1 hypothetical protein [Desulfomicrobium sp.]